MNIPANIPEEKRVLLRRLVRYLDGLQARVSQLRLRQVETKKELDAPMPSILDGAFR